MIGCLARAQTDAEGQGPMSDATFCFVLKSPPQLVSVGEDVEALLGYAQEEFLTAKVQLQDRIHPEDAGLAETLFSQDSTNTSGSVNLRIRHADGRIRCLKARYAKAHTRDDGFKLDMWMEDARKVSEPGDAILIASFKSLIEHTDDYIFLKNCNHVILAASRSLPDFSESANQASELVGKTDYDINPEAIADVGYRLESSAFAEGRRVNEHQQLPTQNGAQRWIDNRKYPINGPGGEIIGILGIAPDITVYVEAEGRLRESEESLRQAQKIAGLGSYALDNLSGVWTSSEVMDEIFGIDRAYERTVGGWLDLIHPDDRSAMGAYFEHEVLGQGKPLDREYRIARRSDGAERWVHGLGELTRAGDGRPVMMHGTIQDITEAKQVEAALRESEETLREAQRIAGLGIHTQDLSTGTWSASDILREILGVGPDYNLSSSRWMDLVHPEDRAAVEARFSKEALSKRPQFEIEHRIVRNADQAVRWVRAVGKIEFDSLGGPVKLRGTIQDITESKQVEAALRESKELLQLFIGHAPVALAMFDSEMRYLAASRRWIQENGVAEQEIIGRCHYDVVPDIPERWKEMHRRGLMGESLRNDEDSFERGDGSTMWLRWQVIPWRTAMGAVGGIILFTEDITEWKRAQTELVRSRELLQLFVEHAPVALAMFDREMRYLAVSRRWAEDHSIDWQEIVGRSHYEVNPEVPERWKETHRRGLAGETQRLEEDRYDRSGGRGGWIRWQITPWRASDGSVGGIVMFYEDITERKLAEAALNESKNLLQFFIRHAPAALAMLDREMRYLAVSRRWLEMHSLGDVDIIGRSHYEIIPGTPESWREEHRRCLAGEKVEACEGELERADGSVQWVRREILPWRAGDGSVGGIVIFSEDVTERKLAEERLRLAATVFTGAREGIMITDPTGTILEVNEAFTRITGYTREEALGRNPRMLQSGLQSKEFYENMWNSLIRDGHWSGEVWNRTTGGNIYAETLTIDAIRDAGGQVKQYVGLFTDITEGKEHEKQLELAAHYDALTGLPNRALFADRLRQAMGQAHRRSQLLGVACFDLDGFKAINDGYGHSSGDALLTALAFRMKRALREGDTLARLGGDEFAAVILDLPDRDACLPTLTSILEAAAKEVQIGDVPLRATISAGVTFYPQAEEVDADMLLRQAGQALYEAKLAGKNRFCIFDPSHDLMARSRHENVEHVRRAQAAHELVLYYQPKVNMRTGKVIGAEALLRWQHPERGLLPPGLFLPVIEDHPLLVEVGNWVIESALAQMEAWQESGFEMPVSVNVSAMELQQPEFVDRLCARLAAHPRVKPSHLELEVLETSALQNVTLSSQVLTACREAGVLISVDDFGTGYSSLDYLRRLPANILKIDQSFVRDMLDEIGSLSILKGVLGLAEAFRREVIAEGVETVDHGLMLLQLGCDCGQGYGIAKPMPAGELEAWATGWHADPRWVEVPVVGANNRAVLFAMVEHHAWYGHFLAYLQGTRPTPPTLDADPCSLSAWLDAQRLSLGGLSPSLVAIETLHQQLHVLAAEIYNAQVSGRKQDGLGLLRQLRYLHERCLKRLQPFTRLSSRKSGSSNAPRQGNASSGSDAA
jgi:diguanylate cyclase (GGDEF)-like protein/PAS domain S-box-containing protein